MQAHVLASYRQEFRYMTISGWNRDRLRELGLERRAGPAGHRPRDVPPARRTSRRRDDMLLALGRTNPLKNLPLTIDAWQRARPTSGPSCACSASSRSSAREHGARYVERPSDEGVNELFNQADGVRADLDATRASACRRWRRWRPARAVVCTDAHGNRDFCVDGVNCLMPEPTVGVGAAARSGGCSATPSCASGSAAPGIETAAEYAWERRIDELEAFLERLAPQRSSAIRGAARVNT